MSEMLEPNASLSSLVPLRHSAGWCMWLRRSLAPSSAYRNAWSPSAALSGYSPGWITERFVLKWNLQMQYLDMMEEHVICHRLATDQLMTERRLSKMKSLSYQGQTLHLSQDVFYFHRVKAKKIKHQITPCLFFLHPKQPYFQQLLLPQTRHSISCNQRCGYCSAWPLLSSSHTWATHPRYSTLTSAGHSQNAAKLC